MMEPEEQPPERSAEPAMASQLVDLSVDAMGSSVVVEGRLSGAAVRPLQYLQEAESSMVVIHLPATASEVGFSRLPVGSRVVSGITVSQGADLVVIKVMLRDSLASPTFTYSEDSFRLVLSAE